MRVLLDDLPLKPLIKGTENKKRWLGVVGGGGWDNHNLAKENNQSEGWKIATRERGNQTRQDKAIRVVGVGWLVEVLQPGKEKS